ncbi:MAG: ABC transporter permease [Deltaproteobacteria bacterium]|nr:ABC transporter permease [Deltaproteobacteria bacterium]
MARDSSKNPRDSRPSQSRGSRRRISRDSRRSLFRRQTLADAGYRRVVQKPISGPATYVLRVGMVGLLFASTFRLIFTARTDKRDTLRMIYRFTNKSAGFVVISMAFVGMIMIYQSTEQLSRAIGDTHLVGAAFIKLLVRVLGPTVIGMLLACRVGAGIAAEIGAMAVTDQLDAMRICSAEPIEVLMVPRVRAGIVASLVLVLIGTATSASAGYITGDVLYGMSPGTYWNFDLIGIADVLQGISKALIYGIAIPVISGACGLAARGGARGVGQATTDAVVGSSFAIVMLDSVVSLVFHAVVGQ